MDKTDNGIYGFFGEYRFLSNFHISPIPFDGGPIFPSAEHAFHFFKTLDDDWRERILNAESPKVAKQLGRMCPMREDWDSVKVKYITAILYVKFFSNKELADKLVETFPRTLEETNTWGDTYWGVCNGVGRNELGKALMAIREEIIRERVN